MRALRIILMALAFISLQAHGKDGRNLAVNQANNAVSEQRIALVIGNGAYSNSPLRNPVNDAKDIATKLRGLGFNVIERNNLQTKQIGGTLREFRSKLVPGAVALVFYAGHGLQIKGDNYLPAVDAEINSEEDVPNQSLAVKQIMDVLDEAKTRLNLVFLDACRNNPYARSFRSADKGLARVAAPSGTLISYATRPGSIAADGGGRNGLYTSKLLAQMDSNLQIEQALKRVVTEVKAASQGKQEPWMEGSIEGDFCFAGCNTGVPAQGATAQPSPAVADPAALELEAWNTAKEMNTEEAYQAYLADHADGRHAKFARAAISKLKSVQQPAQIAMHTPSTMQSGASSDNLNKISEVTQQVELARQQVLVGAFVQDYAKNHPISEDQLNHEYEQLKIKLGNKEYNARHILVETEAEAKDIISQLNKGIWLGDRFEKLAEKSKDAGSRANGGSLGWALPDNFVPPFANAVLNLKKGEYTKEPVQSQFGWHVIRLDDMRDLKVPSLEEVKPKLQQRLQQQAVQKVIADLRSEAKIEIIASAETAAMVNGVPIPQARIELRVKAAAAQGQTDSPELRKAIREDMINLEVMVQEAVKAGLDKNADVVQQIELSRQQVLVGAFVQDYAKKHPVNEVSQDQKQRRQQDAIKKVIVELRGKYKIETIASAETAALVNGVSIPQARINLRVKAAVAQGQADSPELRKAIIEDIINLEVMSQEAAKRGLDQ